MESTRLANVAETELLTYHVISHTHWDREWYLTFEQFRFRLVQLVNNVMDLLEKDEQFKYFHLDGQTIVLEDYLAVHPEQRERLYRLIRQGRLLIGPWYLQNDEFLTSAESTIRNLQTGIAMSRAIAEEMKVGYLPDQFGNISQMPQILSQLGIDNFVFGRGYDIEQTGKQEFLWEGADGTRIAAIFMANWYNNAQRFPERPERARQVLDHIRGKIEPFRTTTQLLLMNGVDHLEAQENLSGILDGLRQGNPASEAIVHGTLPDYVAAVKREMHDPAVVRGELRTGHDYQILAGTLSARVYLKQANARSTDLLEKWLEPLSTWVSVADLGAYPAGYMQFLWKELMKNHPHDSICGCSQDAVHEHMMDRFKAVDEAGEELWKSQAGLLCRQIDTDGMGEREQLLTVFNPSASDASGWVEAALDFQLEESVSHIALLDPAGSIVPFEVKKREKLRKQRLSPINLPTEMPVDRVTIGFMADLIPPNGYKSYRVVPSSAGKPEEALFISGPEIVRSEGVLENEYLQVAIDKHGRLSILNKETGERYADQMIFSDDSDAGDLYVYQRIGGLNAAPAAGRSTANVEATIAELPLGASLGRQVYRIQWELSLPNGLQPDGAAPAPDETVCVLSAVVTLARGDKHLDVKVTFDNRVSDHRLRVLFGNAGNRPITESMAGGQMDVLVRPAAEGRQYKRNANSHPLWKWVASGATEGLALFAKGLHEYEVSPDGDRLELTLLRAAGSIFERSDVPSEFDHQPLGQCPGIREFEFAIRPFGAGQSAAGLANEAERWHHGFRAVSLPVREDLWVQGRPWVQDTDIAELFTRPSGNEGKPKLPRAHSFLRLEGEGIVLSAVKQQLEGRGVVVRFYNAENSETEAHLTTAMPIREAWKGDLLEQPVDRLAGSGNTLSVAVKPKEIVTLLLTV